MKKLLYFGCIRDKGHYLWYSEQNRIANSSALKSITGIEGVTDNFLNSIDGTYTWNTYGQGICKYSLVPPFRIIAWNDFTVDTRPGSNSVLLGIGYESAQEMFAEAMKQFPSVMQRQTIPLQIVNTWNQAQIT